MSTERMLIDVCVSMYVYIAEVYMLAPKLIRL